MDLNQLYFEHQTLQMKADRAISPEIRNAHCRNASKIAGRIGHMQHLMGAAAATGWTALASRNALAERATQRAMFTTAAAPSVEDAAGSTL